MANRTGGEFWRTHVWHRREELVRDRALWSALALATVVTTCAPILPMATMPVTELAELGMLYAALSFAAALTGVGITFGVPGTDRIKRWSSLRSPRSDFSAFSNLAFVFTWAAMVQIGVVIVSFLAILLGRGSTIAPTSTIFEAPFHYTGLFFSLWLWWYALFELTAVIRTVMQVVNAIVVEESQSTQVATPKRRWWHFPRA